MAFPVPRHELPRVVVTPEEHCSRKMQMERMRDTLVEDYEIYSEANGRQVDRRRWKASSTRDRLKLYKERKVRGSGPSSAASLEQSCYVDRDNMSSACNSFNNMSMASNDSAMTFSEEMADCMRMTLMVGECAGRMENAMYAVIANNHAELALVDIFLHEDVADCAILHRMEGPTAQDPYSFLGYKWFVRKSPTNANLVKHRDSVYVEYSGLTKTRSGEELGYHIMHSVDLMGFPEMRDRNCLRTSQSIRALYRQRPGNVVEVFIMGNLDLSGMLMGPIATMFIQETLFNMPKLIDCGEAKRLTKMVLDLRDVRDRRQKTKSGASECCSLCRQPKKRFMGSMHECQVCGLDVCGRCRTNRRVYQSLGILGRFNKVECCKTCVLAAKNAKEFGSDLRTVEASAPRKASSIRTLAEQMEIRQRSSSGGITASALSIESVSGMGSVAPMSSSDSTTSSARSSREEELPVVPFVHELPQPVIIEAIKKEATRQNSIGDSTSAYHTPMMSPVAKLMPVKEPVTAPQQLVVQEAVRSLPVTDSVVLPPRPPPPSFSAARPASHAEMYRKMLELQQKAQEAYDTTKQNQMYIDGRRV